MVKLDAGGRHAARKAASRPSAELIASESSAGRLRYLCSRQAVRAPRRAEKCPPRTFPCVTVPFWRVIGQRAQRCRAHEVAARHSEQEINCTA